MRVFIINKVQFDETGDRDPGYRVGLRADKGYRNMDAAINEMSDMEKQRKLDENPFVWSSDYPFSEDQLADIQDLDGMGAYTIESLDDLQSVLDDHYTELPESTRLELWSMSTFRDDMFYSLTDIEIEDCRTVAAAR